MIGTLAYNRHTNDVAIDTALEEIYSDVMGWAFARQFGSTWLLDIDLCRRTGLEYVSAEFIADDPTTTWLNVVDGALVRTAGEPETSDIRPLREWLEANEAGLESLLSRWPNTRTGSSQGSKRLD